MMFLKLLCFAVDSDLWEIVAADHRVLNVNGYHVLRKYFFLVCVKITGCHIVCIFKLRRVQLDDTT